MRDEQRPGDRGHHGHAARSAAESVGLITGVFTSPPDKAQDKSGDRVNLFLYQTMPDGAWRNMDMPRQLKPGETGHAAAAASPLYLLTAYSGDGDDVKAHQLLGRAMSVLHDHPLLGADEIRSH